MFDAAGLREVRDRLAPMLAAVEPGLYTGADAAVVVELFCEIKNLAAAGELLFAKRVAETGVWQGGADRSAAHWWARRAGVSVGEARAKLDTAERLEALPATTEAVRAGRLSEHQAREITAGAIADPAAEHDLLELAAKDSLKELKNQSRRAQAVDDEAARQARIHRRRSLRSWVDTDGTFRLALATTAEAGSRILTALKPFTDAAFREARRQGRREPLHAYAADGLVALADAARIGAAPDGSGAPRSNVKAILVVDVEALRRGAVEHGETCEIRGVGPVPVDTASRLLGDAALAIVVKDGLDVKNVTHLKRRTTAHQRTVLEFWGIRCNIVGCDSTDFVDVHHTYQWALSHRTRLDELEVQCRHHHRRRHRGWQPTEDQVRSPRAA